MSNAADGEPQIVAISISSPKQPVGYLQMSSCQVNCPSCEQSEWSIVELQAVSCLQRFLNATKLCKRWPGRCDINHYCGRCGCYIGRYIPLGCYERCLSRTARKQAAFDDMRLKVKPMDCAVRAQQSRERVLAWRAERKQKQLAAQTATTTQTPTQIQTVLS
ncbi:CG30195 [Drosophila busckii]|uniref:CG30195 n=1 Tax=Drosophila busckii TaxID=30019 RepID=A0A0M5J0D6_DROBS|nr:uncharacterized protein LOC108595875 [Drosophila busckii]ALC42511.1 CG30195 [Drosophila busckii]